MLEKDFLLVLFFIIPMFVGITVLFFLSRG